MTLECVSGTAPVPDGNPLPVSGLGPLAHASMPADPLSPWTSPHGIPCNTFLLSYHIPYPPPHTHNTPPGRPRGSIHANGEVREIQAPARPQCDESGGLKTMTMDPCARVQGLSFLSRSCARCMASSQDNEAAMFPIPFVAASCRPVM